FSSARSSTRFIYRHLTTTQGVNAARECRATVASIIASIIGLMPQDHHAGPDIKLLLHGEHSDPFAVLGPHEVDGKLAIRILRPGAKKVEILRAKHEAVAAKKLDPDGFFEAVLIDGKATDAYRLKIAYPRASIEIH